MTTKEKIKFEPISGRLTSLVSEYLCLWKKNPLNGPYITKDTIEKTSVRFSSWIDDGYTRPEIMWMGFCIGANINEGIAVQIIRDYQDEYGVEIHDELSEWYYGVRGGQAGAAYHLSQNNYSFVLEAIRAIPENESAFLYALSVGVAASDEHIQRLIDELDAAMNDGGDF